MKKLVYLVAVAFAASMVACGGGNKAEEANVVEEAPAPEIVEEDAAVEADSIAPDSLDVAGAVEEVVE